MDNGKNPFQTYCASCHGITKSILSPPLADVTKRRCMEWLKAVTRNPAEMLQTDDCLKEQQRLFNGVIMQAFPNLSDKAIEEIYAYITAASDSLPPGVKKEEEFDLCHKLVIKDTLGYQTEVKTDRTTVGKSVRPQAEPAEISSGNTISEIPDKPVQMLPDEYYTFTIENFGWFNIDIYIGKDPDFREVKLYVTVKENISDKLNFYLIVPSKKIFVPGVKNKDGKYYFFYREDGYVQLPQNTAAYILAFENYLAKPMMAIQFFTTGTDHNLQLELNAVTDIKSELRSLDLDNFQIDLNHVKAEKKLLINERIYKYFCQETPSIDSIRYNEAASADAFNLDVQK